MKCIKMKNLSGGILILFMSCVFSFSAYSVLNPTASIKWNETTMDFGEIPINEPIVVEFKFNNPGMLPLIISNVKPSCGCTVADYPKQPISSGGEGIISVTFDAKTSGYFSKTITVHSNIEGGITNLFIKGEVVK